ncbi:MAG: thioredoxin family protein [Prevotella sp.]
MKRIIATLSCLCLTLMVTAQTNFRQITFEEAKAAAKAEGKLVFIDFYTDWCGPCKKMASAVFPQPKVGEMMNAKFVSIKIDAEKGDGVNLAKQYSVTAYPTFIIADTEGKEMGRVLGLRYYDDLKNDIERIIDPNKSPEVVKKRFANGERTAEVVCAYTAFLLDEAQESRNRKVYDEAVAKTDSIVASYYGSLSDADKMKNENLFVYCKFMRTPKDACCQFAIANLSKFKQPMQHEVDSIVRMVYDYSINKWLSGKEKIVANDYTTVKKTISDMGFNKDGHLDVAYGFIDEYMKGDLISYIEYCKQHYTGLQEMQKTYLLQNFSTLFKDADDDIKQKASRFLRNQLAEMTFTEMYLSVMQIRELEGDGH